MSRPLARISSAICSSTWAAPRIRSRSWSLGVAVDEAVAQALRDLLSLFTAGPELDQYPLLLNDRGDRLDAARERFGAAQPHEFITLRVLDQSLNPPLPTNPGSGRVTRPSEAAHSIVRRNVSATGV